MIWPGFVGVIYHFFKVFVSCAPFYPSFVKNGAALEYFGSWVIALYTMQLYNLQKEKVENQQKSKHKKTDWMEKD